MTELVLDASVVIKWWRSDGEQDVPQARALRASFETGDLAVIVPPLLFLEILNAFGRWWAWPEDELIVLASSLTSLRFEVEEPELERVAAWTARGLTAYDAAYVAVAEARDIQLVTSDGLILEKAPGLARPLSGRLPNGAMGPEAGGWVRDS